MERKRLIGKIRKKIEVIVEVDADMATEMDCTLMEKTDEETERDVRTFLTGNHKLLPFEKIVSVKVNTLIDDSDFKDKKFYGD